MGSLFRAKTDPGIVAAQARQADEARLQREELARQQVKVDRQAALTANAEAAQRKVRVGSPIRGLLAFIDEPIGSGSALKKTLG